MWVALHTTHSLHVVALHFPHIFATVKWTRWITKLHRGGLVRKREHFCNVVGWNDKTLTVMAEGTVVA